MVGEKPVATHLSGGKIGWLDLLHRVLERWGAIGASLLRRVQCGASGVRSGDQVAFHLEKSQP